MNTDKFEKQCEYCEQPKDYAQRPPMVECSRCGKAWNSCKHSDDHCAPMSTGDIIILAAGSFASGMLLGLVVTIWMV